MRKILFIICWALAGVGLYSCSLDEPSYGKTTSDNYYQKESDIEQALTGAYLQLRTTWNEYALNHLQYIHIPSPMGSGVFAVFQRVASA